MAEQATQTPPWTIGRLLQWTQQYLADRAVDEPRLSTEILLAHVLDCEKIALYTRFDDVPGQAQLTAFRELVIAAADHTPVAYLTGHREFFSLDFAVTPAVLIPRPETEALVVRTLAACERRGLDRPRLLDVGTGSGCVVVTLLKHLPSAAALATDISAEALAVAQRNAETHGVADRIEFACVDGMALPLDRIPETGFDFLVSNPPYVAADEMASLPDTVRLHEPSEALTAGGDGLSLYRVFAEQGPDVLRPDGAVLVEIGHGQAARALDIFNRTGRFAHAGTWRNPGELHDRVMEFRLTPKTGD